MKFNFQIKTKVIFGSNCIAQNKDELAKFGNRAIIVTGKNSAIQSGALEDLQKVFKELRIGYTVFDLVENNPSLLTVEKGGKCARDFSADFVVGIGGGSPLDAAKAVAVLATHDISPIELYDNSFTSKTLPLIAIPTTSGTGSEVTALAILTRNDLNTKKSFGNEFTFPQLAFLDPTYTKSMSYETSINTAIDAFTHALEAYLSKRSTVVSEMISLYSMKLFGECLQDIKNKNFSDPVREKLLFMSLLSGFSISIAGTVSVHSMGYSLTYFKQIPHGRANGILISEYLNKIAEDNFVKINKSLLSLGIKSIEELKFFLTELLPISETFTTDELNNYATIAFEQKSMSLNPSELTFDDIKDIFKNSLIS